MNVSQWAPRMGALLRGLSILALLLTLSALSAPASAQAIGAGDWEVGFDVGATRFDSNVNEDDGFRFSGRAGYHFTDLFQLEAQLSTQSGEDILFDTRLDTAFVNAVFNFHPAETVVPYVLVGVGRAELDASSLFVSVEDDSAAVQAAIGSRFFFGNSNRLAARVEFAVIQEETFDDESEHLSLTAGLTWRLGG